MLIRAGAPLAVTFSVVFSGCGGDASSPRPQDLNFVVQPSRVLVGAAVVPPPQVTIFTLGVGVNTSASGPVTITLRGQAAGTLTGKTTVAAVSGVATFDGLRVDGPGYFRLEASAANALTAVSDSFRVFPPYQRIAAGGGHSCAMTVPGSTYCWGDNGEGQLGIGNEPTGSGFQLPQELPGSSGLGFTALVAGGFHTCALTVSGTAFCWGDNVFNQVGDGTTVMRKSPTAVQMPSGVTFSMISSGYWHTCAVATSGVAYCWGMNGEGALGSGSTAPSSTPVAVAAPAGITFATVSAGGGHTCGITANGVAYCWGENPYGGLGDGTTTARTAPVRVAAGGLSFSTVSAADEYSCALSAGVAYCWGRNDSGQLGDGTMTSQTTPVPVTMPSGVAFASLHAGSFGMCALTATPTAGSIYCWGRAPTLVPAPDGVTFATLSVGKGHACAVTAAGIAYCWGLGPLGNSSGQSQAAPYPVVQ